MATRTKLESEIRAKMEATYGHRINELHSKLAAFRETNETLEQRLTAAEALLREACDQRFENTGTTVMRCSWFDEATAALEGKQ